MEDGFKYLFSLNGLLKLLSMAFSCITFSLLAASNVYLTSTLEWVLAAFIISFSISFLFLFFRLLGFSSSMQCGESWNYNGFDFLWSWFSASWCFAAAIGFATNFPEYSDGEAIGSIVFAFCTFIVYGIEAFYLRIYAPANIGFVATKQGWIKTAIVVLGAATFGLMVDSGYPDNCDSKNDGCVEGLTYSLVAFTVAWSISTIMWLAHLFGPTGSIEGSPKFKQAEMVWAVIGVLFFWSGASVFAAYMSKDCPNDASYQTTPCQKRVSGVTVGFITGALYLLEAFILK